MLADFRFSVEGITEVQAEELMQKFTEAAEAVGGIVGGGVTFHEGYLEGEPADLEALATKVKDLEAKLKAEPQVGLKHELEGYNGQQSTPSQNQ